MDVQKEEAEGGLAASKSQHLGPKVPQDPGKVSTFPPATLSRLRCPFPFDTVTFWSGSGSVKVSLENTEEEEEMNSRKKLPWKRHLQNRYSQMPRKTVNSLLHFWPHPPPCTQRVHHTGSPLTNGNYSLPQGCPEFVEPRQSEERDETLKQLQVLFVRLTEIQLSTDTVNTLAPTILTVWYPGNNTLNILTGDTKKAGGWVNLTY